MSFKNSSSWQLPPPIHHPASDESTAHFGNFKGAFRIKSSKYRGVQKLKGKETYVAHVYDNGYTPTEGRTIYLGRFEKEENAARAHDMVSLKFWGTSAQTNFPISDYGMVLKTMEKMTDLDVVAAIRRCSNSFSRGKSKYRGVVRHANTGKWQARKGPGKDSFLGTFETEEEAAIAFDIASIELKGFKAITNFDINSYNVSAIVNGQTEPPKEAEKLEVIGVSNNQEKQESSRFLSMGIGNRKKKRQMNYHHFLGKHKGMGYSRKMNMSNEKWVSISSGSQVVNHKVGVYSHLQGMTSSMESSSGFEHSNSSAFQSYKQTSRSESSIMQEAKNPSSIFQLLSSKVGIPPHNVNSPHEEQESRAIRFQHASSSCFKPFREQ
nr:AP2-like ethylene-responsive transcription factor BBM [Ziziphus jujuba var. spinosa]